MKRSNGLVVVLILIFVMSCNVVFAQVEMVYNSGEFTTEDVADATVDGIEDCLDYCFIGLCVILVCSIYECHLEYVPRVSHNMPDLIVSTYPEPGDISWVEAKKAYGDLAKSGGSGLSGLWGAVVFGGDSGLDGNQGSSDENINRRRNPDLNFKEVAAIGNPIVGETISTKLHFGVGYICSTDTDEFFPYFLSELDALSWRTNIPELFYWQTWAPWARVIGNLPTQRWGKVHPRHGYLIQGNDAKAAAVMSQRAVDIVTRQNQPHVYRRLRDVAPSNEDEERWQMISPELSSQCIAFGKDVKFGLGDQNATDRKYGYLYWATHKCCASTFGLVIGYIETDPYCI